MIGKATMKALVRLMNLMKGCRLLISPENGVPRAGAVTRRKGLELSSLSEGTKTSLGKDVLRSRPALKNEFCAPREGSESWYGKGDT